MAHKKRGNNVTAHSWARHLRSVGKRLFWGRERFATKQALLDEVNDLLVEDVLDENEIEQRLTVTYEYENIEGTVFVLTSGYPYEGEHVVAITTTFEEAYSVFNNINTGELGLYYGPEYRIAQYRMGQHDQPCINGWWLDSEVYKRKLIERNKKL